MPTLDFILFQTYLRKYPYYLFCSPLFSFHLEFASIWFLIFKRIRMNELFPFWYSELIWWNHSHTFKTFLLLIFYFILIFLSKLPSCLNRFSHFLVIFQQDSGSLVGPWHIMALISFEFFENLLGRKNWKLWISFKDIGSTYFL